MSRATLKLKRPITQIDIDIDENDLEANGFVKVVRCKECRWKDHCKIRRALLCDWFTDDDAYCVKGERREDEVR